MQALSERWGHGAGTQTTRDFSSFSKLLWGPPVPLGGHSENHGNGYKKSLPLLFSIIAPPQPNMIQVEKATHPLRPSFPAPLIFLPLGIVNQGQCGWWPGSGVQLAWGPVRRARPEGAAASQKRGSVYGPLGPSLLSSFFKHPSKRLSSQQNRPSSRLVEFVRK